MRKALCFLALFLFFPASAFAQESGNRTYGTPRRKPQISSGVLTGSTDGKGQVYFVEASVLLNMKADAYVAVFGLVQDGFVRRQVKAQLAGQVMVEQDPHQ